MSKSTPGPWKVATHYSDPNAYDIESEAGTKITRGYWGTAACADARLIAAAPDLYESLLALCRALAIDSRFEDVRKTQTEYLCALVKDGFDALSKAKADA